MTRIASLEAYSNTQRSDIDELKREVRGVRDVVECIRRDMHGAKIGGRVALAIAMALGGLVSWAIQVATKH